MCRTSLEQHDVTPDRYVNLAEIGVPKEYHTDSGDAQADERYSDLVVAVDGPTTRLLERGLGCFVVV